MQHFLHFNHGKLDVGECGALMLNVTLRLSTALCKGTAKRKLVCLVSLLTGTGAALALEPSRFDDANIRSTIQTLSSDAFGGRAPASAGETLTTDYIVTQFRRYGLQPANHGSFLQEVPLHRSPLTPMPC